MTDPSPRPGEAAAGDVFGRVLAQASATGQALVPAALAGAWLGYYLITGLPFIELETFRATVTLHAVTGVVLVPYLLALIVWRRLPGGSVLDAPLVALVLAYLIATAASFDPRLSLEATLTPLLGLGVFYVLSDRRLFRRWQVELAFMAAVLAAALYALWVVGDDYLDWLRLTDAVRGGLGLGDLIPPTVPKVHDVGDHPNLLGGILATSLPFFFVALFRRVHLGLKAVAALAAVAIVLAAFLALARSAWLGGAAGVAVSAMLLLVATPEGRALPRRFWPLTARRQLALGTVALAAAAVLVVVAFVVASVDARPIWLFRESGAPRVDVMEAGAEMFADHPLAGVGPGVYTLLYPEYSGRFPNHAFHSHNGYLQVAVDLGLPGIAAVLALAGALAWLLYRGLRETEGEARLSLIACAGAFVAFGIFSLFDAPNGFKGPLAALAAVGAVAVLGSRERIAGAGDDGRPASGWARAGRYATIAARVALPVALAGLLITWGRIDAGHYYYSQGLSNAKAGNWAEAIDDARRSAELDPSFAIYWLQLGSVQGQAYLDAGSDELLDDAIGNLERGLELEPRSAIGYANLALLEAEANDREATLAAAQSALEFANSDVAVVLAAGSALEEANWGDEAVRAYARALFLDAGLADSPFWTGTAFRRTRFDDVIGSSALVFNPCALLRLIVAGIPTSTLDRSQAIVECADQTLTQPGNEDARITLALALIEDDAYEDAFVQLDYVIGRQPDNGRARTALGVWYDAQGDTDAAREQWLRAAQLEDVEGIVLLGDSYPEGEVPPEVVEALRAELRESASQVQFHLTGILYYRFKFYRASPVTILLPGDWRDAVPGRYADARDALERWTGG